MITELVTGSVALWPVAIPLAAAGLTLLLRRRPLLQRSVMELAVVLMLGAAIMLFVSVSSGTAATVRFGGWSAPFGITFVADQLNAALSVVTGIVALAVTIFARADIRARRRRDAPDRARGSGTR